MSRPTNALIGLAALALLPAVALAEPSPGTATWISLGSTLVPCAAGTALFVSDNPEAGWSLAAAGVMLGPAAGYLYGGRTGRGLAGVGIRAGASVVGVLGVGSMFDETNDSWGGAIVALAAAAGIATSMVVDLALVGRDVRRQNERRSVALVPWRSREGAPGLAVSVGF